MESPNNKLQCDTLHDVRLYHESTAEASSLAAAMKLLYSETYSIIIIIILIIIYLTISIATMAHQG